MEEIKWMHTNVIFVGGLYEDADVNSPENKIDPFTGGKIKFYRKELVIRDYKISRTRINYNPRFSCQLNMQLPYHAHDVCPDCMKKIEDFCRLIRVLKEAERNA